MRPPDSAEASSKETAMMRRIMGLLSIASLLVSATYLHAQGYPNQPISLVLPYAPGDTGEFAGRAMAEELARMLKAPVVPSNRPGAGAFPGTAGVLKAKQAGNTVIIEQNQELIYVRL